MVKQSAMNNAIESSRSPFVTALAWLFITLSGVTVLSALIQISVIALAVGPIAFMLPVNIMLVAAPVLQLSASSRTGLYECEV